MATICLNMIVKNEADIIEETLENILFYVPIDYWVIADTGSNDNTPDIIQNFFQRKSIKGELLHHKWKNFAHNRQLALDAASGLADYVLIFDADDRFIGERAISHNPELTEDVYAFSFKNEINSSYVYYRNLLIKNNGCFKWIGAVHEQIVNSTVQAMTMTFVDMTVLSGRFGARNKDPNKYHQDIKMLEEEYQETNDLDLKLQDAYFCAQSYRDLSNYEKENEWLMEAFKLSSRKTKIRHYLLMSLAKNQQRLTKYNSMVNYLQQACEEHPSNAEPLVHLAKHFLEQNNFEIAFHYAQKALSLPIPNLNDVVSIDYDIFHIDRYVIFCLASLNLGLYKEAYSVLNNIKASDEKIYNDLFEKIIHILEILKLVNEDCIENN